MDFFYYLKQQIYILVLASLAFSMTYYVAVFCGWRDPITISIPFIICFSVAFILIGTLVRFLTQGQK